MVKVIVNMEEVNVVGTISLNEGDDVLVAKDGKFDNLDIMLVINELARECHSISKSKGFYDAPVSFPQSIALIHSELSEALEADRSNDPALQNIEEELADAVIRILDLCGYRNYNLGSAIINKLEKNRARAVKHGKRY